jgi:hypothetical protein
MHKKNAYNEKKPFVYHSAVFGDYQSKSNKSPHQSKQLIKNSHQAEVSS